MKHEQDKCQLDFVKPIYSRGKDQRKNCTAHHGEPLLCPCERTRCNFFSYYFGLRIVASPSRNEQSTFLLRGGDVITSPLSPLMMTIMMTMLIRRYSLNQTTFSA